MIHDVELTRLVATKETCDTRRCRVNSVPIAFGVLPFDSGMGIAFTNYPHLVGQLLMNNIAADYTRGNIVGT